MNDIKPNQDRTAQAGEAQTNAEQAEEAHGPASAASIRSRKNLRPPVEEFLERPE